MQRFVCFILNENSKRIFKIKNSLLKNNKSNYTIRNILISEFC